MQGRHFALPTGCFCAPPSHPPDWSDIAGQEPAKRLIEEVVVWPMKNPDLFTVRWRACLLERTQRGWLADRRVGSLL